MSAMSLTFDIQLSGLSCSEILSREPGEAKAAEYRVQECASPTTERK